MSVVSMDEATLNQMHQEAEPKDVVSFKLRARLVLRKAM
jgi:hypothetical protein